ncbi:MAG: fibrinogen-like YCDxxxxGGGW domain-containing protein [Candidatus Gracilibacteria bacterium]|nr:fibrinogen-like YCDxxxxGGGW domain-containing protein [Candidatus Gracilibacteria bacterium]
MKKFILFISILLSGIYLVNFISAITITKNSGEVLDNSTWGNIAGLTDKIDVSSSDIKLNGKLYVTGSLCDNDGNCLGQCSDINKHWDKITSSCINNVQDCTVEKPNATLATKTWNGVDDYGECTIQTCADGYVKNGDSCEQPSWGTSSNPGTSCLDLKNKGVNTNGVYWIKPSGTAFQAYCIMDWNGGGYTVVGATNTRKTTISPGASDIGSVPSTLNSSTSEFLFSDAKITAISGTLWTYAGYGDAKAMIIKHDVSSWYYDYRNGTSDLLYDVNGIELTPKGRRFAGRQHGPGIMRSGGNTRCSWKFGVYGAAFCSSSLYKTIWKDTGAGAETVLYGPMLLMKK